jgi:GH25 family lysozyme M1 (1,4-beta-N-acetylmuramidase)
MAAGQYRTVPTLVPETDPRERLVDVSQWQGKINWATLATKARGAWIRSALADGQDVNITRNWAESKGKLPRGAYLAFYPQIDPDKQVAAWLKSLGGDYGELPPVVDVEMPKQSWSDAWRESLKDCLESITQIAKRRPVVYTGTWYMPYVGSAPWLADYSLWLAAYVPELSLKVPEPWSAWTVWQHSSGGDGNAHGVESEFIDLDILNVPIEMLFPITPAPTPVPAPAPEAPMFVTKPLSQRDPAWAGDQLGFGDNTSTIGTYGCTLTCATMVVNGFGKQETPATLNAKLKALGWGHGYTGNTKNLFVFSGIHSIFHDIKFANIVRCRDVAAPMDVVDGALAKGNPVMVELDGSPAPGPQYHWVVIYAKRGNDYLIHDPWPVPAEESALLSRYALKPEWTPARIITSIVLYERSN